MPFGSVKLNDGNEIPSIAFGTGSKWKGHDVTAYVEQAIEVGFSHIDTAQFYQTETYIGDAIKESGLARSDFFLTSKFSGLGTVEQAIQDSLKNLGVSQLDLYLIHSPAWGGSAVWAKLEGFQKAGLAKSIGVSNYDLEGLQSLVKDATVVPAVNQINFSPYNYTQHKPLLEYAAKHDIIIEAYSSLSPVTKYPGGPVDKPVAEAAKRLGATPTQVILAWVRSKGVVIVTTSSKKDRMQEYLDVADLPELTTEEIEAIDKAGSGGPPKSIVQRIQWCKPVACLALLGLMSWRLSSETDSSRSDSSMTVAQEGEIDDNPIRLQGDTAEEFRALLWALYALPHEFMLATGPDANCVQLVHLARISHKYQFRSIETWALGVLNSYFNLNPTAFDTLPSTTPTLNHPNNHPTEGSTPSLVQVTELATLWEGKDLALAISIGERFNLKPILGLAYFHMMLKGRQHWDTEASLSRDQRIRLLSGYYSLGKLWDVLPSQPPVLTHSARCTSQQRCTKAWGALWKASLETSSSIIPTLPREDILTRLGLAEAMVKALVEAQIPSQGFLEGIPHCRESARVATQIRVREIKDSLADYFSDEF
ncbi:hypothetical protein EUX98_g4138 [Antrodiella citrinella]|uniref:NADP-dependent oxidoreductase domain-containing protein n=1 Tax=Antrodiella citrinella TaxID=2447956 RepID=A0A4S4MUV5_9APHY|nr:hypothetical protein EUX98_g4138 [Antrodiella citrinella]